MISTIAVCFHSFYNLKNCARPPMTAPVVYRKLHSSYFKGETLTVLASVMCINLCVLIPGQKNHLCVWHSSMRMRFSNQPWRIYKLHFMRKFHWEMKAGNIVSNREGHAKLVGSGLGRWRALIPRGRPLSKGLQWNQFQIISVHNGFTDTDLTFLIQNILQAVNVQVFTSTLFQHVLTSKKCWWTASFCKSLLTPHEL